MVYAVSSIFMTSPPAPSTFSMMIVSPSVIDMWAVMMRAMPQLPAEEVPIHNGHRCSLLELSKEKCRWPISNPGAVDFWFCGNKPIEGLPYCAGHARIAFQPAFRQRSAWS